MCHCLVETRFIFGARSGVRVDGKLSGEEDKRGSYGKVGKWNGA
jgi:hypothetical protein